MDAFLSVKIVHFLPASDDISIFESIPHVIWKEWDKLDSKLKLHNLTREVIIHDANLPIPAKPTKPNNSQHKP